MFKDDGSRTAAAYAAAAGDASARNGVVGPDNYLSAARLGPRGRLQRRQAFVLKLLQQIMQVHTPEISFNMHSVPTLPTPAAPMLLACCRHWSRRHFRHVC